MRGAEGRVVPALLGYILKTFGESFVDHAWDDFFFGDAPDDMAAAPEFDTMFIPWLVLWFVRDENAEEADPEWPDQPIGLEWLETGSPEIGDIDRRFIETASRSPMSVFVIESAIPGRSVDLQDVLTGRRFHALESSASQTLRAGDLLFTRIVTIGETSVMFGASPFSVPPRWHAPIIDWRDRLTARRRVAGRRLGRQDLADYDIEIRDLYLRVIDDVLNPELPVLKNTDGDDIEWTTLTYELGVSVQDAFTLLKPLATVRGEEFIDEVVCGPSGTITEATLTWSKAGNRQHKEWTNTSLGNIALTAGRLRAEVNSKKRADRLQREIERRLGLGATFAERTTMDVRAALEERQHQRAARTRADHDPPEIEETDPALLEVEIAMFRQHLDQWIETRVPALGRKTPAQAAKTAGGRERLTALLNDFERSAEAQRGASDKLQALAELRARLGVGRTRHR
jgi:hypothetical protein